jgi:bifunctional lysine-specific demethylase and histidyl-hydroxylase MINA
MLLQDAQRRLQEFLAPLTLDEFLGRTLGGGFCRIAAAGAGRSTELLGPDPQALLLGAVHLAPRLTFHSANPVGPPPGLDAVGDAGEFARRIAEFHARHYSVRFPELRPLSPALDELARALEFMLHAPVTASAFWSRGGMRAPVHYDDHDLIVVQLRGDKRWYVSEKPSELPNTWASTPAEALEIDPHASVDLHPGDRLYLPRGTLHSVDSDAESLHLSIGFTPLTVREALIAALDQLSDVDRTLRTTLGGGVSGQFKGGGMDSLTQRTAEALERLRAACRTPGFLAAALQHRSTRVVARFAALPAPAAPPAIATDTELVHTGTAMCHLTASPERIDFSYPGGHLYLHRGAEQSILFMVNTRRFRVRDIPGEIADDVRLSLAAKLVGIGFLAVFPVD